MAIKSPWIVIRRNTPSFSLRLDRRVPFITLCILLVATVVLVLSVSYGEYHIPPGQVVQTILGTNTDHHDYDNFHLVVFTFRLPRIILAFLVGMALATSGTAMQSITRNPLADPSVLGISGGAGVAVVALIIFGNSIPNSYLIWGAFGGGLLTAALIYTLSWQRGHQSPLRMALIGVAFAAGANAITTLMLTFGEIRDVQQAYVWLTGSVYGRNWEHVRLLATWMIVFIPLTWLLARPLNVLNLGDETAKGLGMRVEIQRGILFFSSVALTASAVAVSGTIGFIGLIAPHAVRRLVGPAHEGLLPLAGLFGGLLLILADLIGRWMIAPSEMPVGVVVSLIGAPYFIFLLYRYRNEM